jgi:hypothetical protein
MSLSPQSNQCKQICIIGHFLTGCVHICVLNLDVFMLFVCLVLNQNVALVIHSESHFEDKCLSIYGGVTVWLTRRTSNSVDRVGSNPIRTKSVIP